MKHVVKIVFPILVVIYLYLTIIKGTFESFDNNTWGSDIVLSVLIVNLSLTLVVIYMFFRSSSKNKKGIIDDKEYLFNKIYYLSLLILFNILYFWVFLPFNDIANTEFGMTLNGSLVHRKEVLIYYLVLDGSALIFGSILMYRLVRDFLKKDFTRKYNNIHMVLFVLFFGLVMYSKFIYAQVVYLITTAP